MSIPNLKRIRISSELELMTWLAKNPDHEGNVMLVTHTDTSHIKYFSREQVGDALAAHGWSAGPKYTLNVNLLGHVISKHRE